MDSVFQRRDPGHSLDGFRLFSGWTKIFQRTLAFGYSKDQILSVCRMLALMHYTQGDKKALEKTEKNLNFFPGY